MLLVGKERTNRPSDQEDINFLRALESAGKLD